jgi:RHS repeat-associated protein
LKGDPINPGTGNKFESVEIYRGPGVFPLDFSVSYNSQNGNSSILAPAELVMGARRVHSYLRIIRLESNAVTATAYALRPDGKVLGFNRSGTSWIADSDVSDTLTASYAADGSIAGWTYTTGNGDHESYNSAGQLIALTTKGGFTQTLAYGSSGTLASVTDPEGRSLTFSYDGSGRISTLQTPGGLVYEFAYDASDNLKTITYPDSSVLTLAYGENGAGADALTGVVDESGNRVDTTKYDSAGRATSTSGPDGIDQTSFVYEFTSAGTLVEAVTGPLGKVETSSTEYLLGTVRPLTVTETCTGCTTVSKQYSYDSHGYLASYTDFDGHLTTTTYDSTGLLTQQVEASGTGSQRTTNLTWDTTLRVPLSRTVLDASGHTVSITQWAYNTRGQPLARCEIDPTNSAASGYACTATGMVPAGVRRWTYTYCDAVDSTPCPVVGLLLNVAGPRTDLTQVTTYTYYLDASATDCGTPGGNCHQPGDLHTVTDALGHVTTIVSYDADGRITRETDPNGVETDMTYTPRGWLASRSVGGATTTFTYTPYGAVASLTDPDGIATTYTYDAAHRLTDITDAEGNRLHYTLDAAGHKTAEQVVDASGTVRRSLTRTYNALGELTAVVDGLNQTVFSAGYSDSYDADGHLVHSADGRGVQQHQGYDALNRLVQTIQDYAGTDTGTANATTAFGYDPLDRLTGVTDPGGLATTYAYDGLSDATGQTSPDTGSTTRTYDAAGNVLTRTDARGITATNRYDALDRLVGTTYPDSTQDVTYRYDEPDSVTGCTGGYGIGRLTHVVEHAVSTSYCYDARGHVVRKHQYVNHITDVTYYGWSPAGRLLRMQYPDRSHLVYSRDADGRIASVALKPLGKASITVVRAVTYLPFGPVSGYTLGNAQQITRAYDANYRLTDLTSPAFSLHVARDVMGNLTAIGNGPGANPATENYRYDALDRLTAITEADGSTLESVTYNKTGDRLGKNGSGLATGTYSYAPGTHQLIATGNQARTVDANGNTTGLTEAGVTSVLGYDDRNRLGTVQQGQDTVASYTYNALGERVRKIAGSLNERYDYDEGRRLVAEYGATNRDYIWLDDVPVAVVDAAGGMATVSYVTADQLGTPRAISDAGGTTVWQWSYAGNAWGEQGPTSNGYIFNLRFPGQYYDRETGLADNGYRALDANIGGYVQPDPLGLFGGQSSIYAYVGSNPLFYVDQFGLQAKPAPAPIFGPSTEPVPNYGSPANDPEWIDVLPELGGGLGSTCVAVAGGVTALLYPEPTADSCSDEPLPPPGECSGDDNRCAKAKQDAQSAYSKLITKRIPQFQTGGTRGRDSNHLTSILQLQARLRDAIRRVILYCKQQPPELQEWERAANLNAPGF